MKNLINFLIHYKGVSVAGIFFAIIGWAMFSNHKEMMIWNGAWSYVIYMGYIAMVVVYCFFVANQWGLFKRSEWYQK